MLTAPWLVAFCFAFAFSVNAQPAKSTFYFEKRTPTPLSRQGSNLHKDHHDLSSYRERINRECILGSNGDPSMFRECLNKRYRPNESFQANTLSSVSPLIRQCADAGYSRCFSSRVKAVVVQVESATSGSAVIVGDNGRDYLLATSRHVVDAIGPSEAGEVFWNGTKIGEFNQKNLWLSKNYDIALIRLPSKEILPVAPIAGPELSLIGSSVTVAGFPVVTDLTPKIKNLRISKGSIAVQEAPGSSKNGYSLGYTSPTTEGMSGGGAFVQTTCKQDSPILSNTPIPMLVGVHGRAEVTEAKGATGFNFSVPASALGAYNDFSSFTNPKKFRATFGCPSGPSGQVWTFN